MHISDHIRASSCGRFIVVQIGAARPHVLSLEDAESTAEQYLAAADALTGPASAWQRSTARAIVGAIAEARGA